MYMWNSLAERFYREQGVHRGPKRSYGRIPVMTSAHPLREGEIRTPKEDRFVVVKPEGCDYRLVLTAEPASEKPEKGKAVCLDFSIETMEEVREVLEKWL